MLGINTNVNSLYSQATLNVGLRRTESAVQRLSSGLRVNSARDDAAGLAISTRLSAIARGLDAALSGVSMGTSKMQVADGALSTVSDNLQRMRELALQASTGTISDSDRASLDKEYQALAQENKRIIENTEFNRQKVFGDGALNTNIQVGGQSGQTADFGMQAFFRNNAVSISGSLQSIFRAETLTIGQGPQNVNRLAGTSANIIGNGPDGLYDINVATLGQGANYSSGVGPGGFGVAGVTGGTTYANGGRITNATGPADTYAVNVNTLADNYVYTDTIGGPNFGTAARNALVDNSNPGVATALANPADGNYNVNVTSVARAQSSSINIGNGTFDLGGGLSLGTTFTIDYGGGANETFQINNGAVTGADVANAINAASSRVTARYDNGTGRLTVTSDNTGTNNSFTIDAQQNVGGAPDANVFDMGAGDIDVTAANATGNVNGTAFNSQSNSNLTVAGLNFDVNGTGSTLIQQATASTNSFRLDFGDGSGAVTFGLPAGAFTATDYVSAFNSAQSKFTASYNAGTGVITYTGNEDGANETFTVTNLGSAVNNAFNMDGTAGTNSTVTQTGTNFTGTVDRGNNGGAQAFNSASATGITADGLTFDVTGLGAELVTITAPVTASTNSFRLDFGDGSNTILNLGTGTFTGNDFVNAFNAAQSKFTAVYDGTNITYTNNEVGSNSSLAITDLSSNDAGVNDVFQNMIQTQVGQDTTGTVSFNGGAAQAFSITSGSTATVAGITFEVASTGLTQYELTTPPPTTSTFGVLTDDLEDADNARETIAVLDSYLDSVSNLRGVLGANMSRLDSIGFSIRQDYESYMAANSRIIDADFARETARLTREQFLQQAGIGILTQANQQPELVFRLLA